MGILFSGNHLRTQHFHSPPPTRLLFCGKLSGAYELTSSRAPLFSPKQQRADNDAARKSAHYRHRGGYCESQKEQL